MSVFLIVLLAIALVVLVYGVMIYNALVQAKHNVSKAWANIDVLLKQRHDELPKLVEACKQYKEFEQSTLDKVISARSRVHEARKSQDMGALGQAESALRMGLGNIFAVAEAYPDLKANTTMMQLSEELTSTENRVSFSRQAFNDAVMSYNTLREQFPGNLVANNFGFQPAAFLEIESAEKRTAPQVKFT
jgi:LemA protein